MFLVQILIFSTSLGSETTVVIFIGNVINIVQCKTRFTGMLLEVKVQVGVTDTTKQLQCYGCDAIQQ